MGGVILSMTTKNSTLWWTLRILEIGMQILLFFIVLLMLFYHSITADVADILSCLLLSGFPVLVLYLARLFVKNNILITLVHICVAAFLLMFGENGEEKLAYILLGAALMIYSLSLSGAHQKPNSEKIPIGFACLFIIAMFLGKQAGVNNMVMAGMYSGSMFLVLEILYLNFDSVNKYISMNHGIANLPVKQIISVNAFQMSVLVTLFGGIVFLFSNRYVSRVVEKISGFVADTIRFVLKAIFSIGKDFKSEGLTHQALEGGKGLNELWALVEDSLWMDILNAIGMIFGSLIGMVFLIVLSAAVTIILLKKLKNLSFGAESDVKEFLIPRDIVEFQFKNSRKKKERGTGDNRKVRKLYKSHVLKRASQKGDAISAAMMPDEISKRYVPDVARQVTDIYEKARYGDGMITREEIISFRDYLK